MDIITLIIELVILSIIFWVLWEKGAPLLPQPIQNVVRGLIVLLTVLILLWMIGLVPNPLNVRVGR